MRFLEKIAPYNKESLLASIADGDEKSFALFFEEHQKKVFSIAYYFTQSTVRAEDVVQDVFVKIWNSRHQLTGILNMEGWVATLARNYSLNELKRVANERIKEEKYKNYLPTEVLLPAHLLISKELKKNIHEALNHVTEQQRAVFIYSKMEGRNRQEIAAILGLSPNTVKMHLVRASRFVRAYLSQRMGCLFFAFFLLF